MNLGPSIRYFEAENMSVNADSIKNHNKISDMGIGIRCIFPSTIT